MLYDQNELDLRSSKEVARVLGVTVDCLVNWRCTGGMKDVAAWLETKKSNGSVQSPKTAGAP
jgi:hypothetical protein